MYNFFLSELGKRLISSILLVVVFVGLLNFLPEDLIVFVVFLLFLLAGFELGRMLKLSNLYSCLICVCIFLFMHYMKVSSIMFFINSLVCLFLVLIVLLRPGLLNASVNKYIEFFYFLICLYFFCESFIYFWKLSITILLFSMVLVWTTDIMAFFVGKKFGKTKCFSPISPNKSLEGLLAGLFFALVMSYFFIPEKIYSYWFLFGFCSSVFAIIGDLFESLLKRRANVKDSGSIIPGHGGVLDRIDGLVFSVPVFLFLYNIAT
jgi:phosphatidate cytidylyltransferase